MAYKIHASFIWGKNKAELKREPYPEGDGKHLERLLSIGVRIGDEFSENSSEGALIRMGYIFGHMIKPSHLIFTWDPPDRERSFFQRMKNREMSLTIGINRDDKSAHYALYFNDLKIIRVSGNRRLERIEARYGFFGAHPDVF